MDPAIRRLIEAIHASPFRCVLALTGGGTQAAAMLLNVPGGSRSILEVIVPYHEQALTEFLGHRPASFCSAEAAAAMAERAHARACWLAPGESVIGLGCTASLVSDRPKQGAHRVHASTQTELATFHTMLTLTKGARDREGEESIVDGVIINALAAALGLGERIDLPLLPAEQIQHGTMQAAHHLARLLLGNLASICVQSDGRHAVNACPPTVLMPGSFNPIHPGHWQLAEAATRRTGAATAFELSISNVDKPTLEAGAIRRRLAAFEGRAEVWLTCAPTFAEKSELFPGVTFVIGADTALRLVQARYYGDSKERMTAALEKIRNQGCRFLVAGRVAADGRFLQLDQVAIPAEYRDLFTPLPESEFRADVSSTFMRNAVTVAGGKDEG